MRRQSIKYFMIAFTLSQLFLAGFFMDLIISPNPTSRVLPVLTVIEDKTLQIDKYKNLSNDKSFVNGHYYSDKAPLTSFIVMPVYGIYRFCRQILHHPTKNFGYDGATVQIFGDFLCGVVPFVFLLLVSFWSIKDTRGGVSPVLLATLPFYSSFVFVYSGTFFGHNLSAALLLGSYLCLRKKCRPILSGYLLGASILSEYTVALAVPIWFIQIFYNEDRSKAFRFLSGLLPWLGFALVYNFLITGSPWRSPYAFHSDAQFAQLKSNYGFLYPKWSALWGLSLSPFRGLVFYTPILILIGYLLCLKWSTFLRWRRLASSYVASFGISSFLVISSHFTWWGGWCYGPRYLMNMAVLLLFESICLLARTEFSRVCFFSLTLIGLIQTTLAKSTVLYMASEGYSSPLTELIIPEFRKGKLNSNNLLTLIFGTTPLYAVCMWAIMFAVLHWVLVRWYQNITTSNPMPELS